MLSDEKRADLLAQTGPVLAVALFEATGQRWVFVPQEAADFGILSRCADGMKIGMMPGWFDQAARFEFAPFIRLDGIAHTPQSLGLVPRGGPGAAYPRHHDARPGGGCRRPATAACRPL